MHAMCEGLGFYSYSKAGEIIYLTKCKAVEVEIINKNVCYNELSVLYNKPIIFHGTKNKDFAEI